MIKGIMEIASNVEDDEIYKAIGVIVVYIIYKVVKVIRRKGKK